MNLFYHWKGCGKLLTCVFKGLKDHVVKRFSPGPSFAGLFWALQALAVSQASHRSSTEMLGRVDAMYQNVVKYGALD